MNRPFTEKYKIIHARKRLLTALADTLLSPIYRLKRGPLNPPIPWGKIKKILVIRTAYIGDVLMTLPILKPLKLQCPQAKIHFLTPYAAASLLENHPYLDKIISYDAFWFYKRENWFSQYRAVMKELKKESYDLIIEARGDIRDLLFLARPLKASYKTAYAYGGGEYFLSHPVPYPEIIHKTDGHLNILEHLGVPILPEDREMKIYLQEKETSLAKETLSKLGVHFDLPLVGIHPGGRKPLKSWPSDRYGILAKNLQNQTKAQILVTGTPEEIPLIDEMKEAAGIPLIVLAGKTSFREMAALISYCNLFITNDSAPMHLAVSVGAPTLALFGPSKSLETAPYGTLHQFLEEDYPCRWTCDEDQCYYKEYQACMKAMTVERVTQTAVEMLNETTHYIK